MLKLNTKCIEIYIYLVIHMVPIEEKQEKKTPPPPIKKKTKKKKKKKKDCRLQSESTSNK